MGRSKNSLDKAPTVVREPGALYWDDFDGDSPKAARLTSPYMVGDLVKYDTPFDTKIVSGVIVGVWAEWNNCHGEFIPKYRVCDLKKDGTPGRRFRYIYRGNVTRGFAAEYAEHDKLKVDHIGRKIILAGDYGKHHAGDTGTIMDVEPPHHPKYHHSNAGTQSPALFKIKMDDGHFMPGAFRQRFHLEGTQRYKDAQTHTCFDCEKNPVTGFGQVCDDCLCEDDPIADLKKDFQYTHKQK